LGSGRLMDIQAWLRGLGLVEYEAAFRDNAIDEKILLSLTAEDLKDLGIALVGHRRRLLDAIAALRAEPIAKTRPAGAADHKKGSAERRQVTVVFADLVGSTALAAGMDPEDLREVVTAYHRCAGDTVRRVGGFVSQYLGDGVLVYFGYPHAHEDDAERAVRASLNLIAAVATLKTRTALQARVGVATGLVVVGDVAVAIKAEPKTEQGHGETGDDDTPAGISRRTLFHDRWPARMPRIPKAGLPESLSDPRAFNGRREVRYVCMRIWLVSAPGSLQLGKIRQVVVP
jgi:SAM domain (Sterile alpha motif)/Adenylate and Guanylate cyclase catalytic domain